MAGSQRPHLVRDAEQLGDELFQHGRKLDDEIGFRLALQLFGRGARRHQPVVQLRTLRLEKIHELAVEADQAVAAIKVREPQIEPEGQAFSHRSDRPRTPGHVADGTGRPDPRSGISCTID